MRLFKQMIVINTELPRYGAKARVSPWTPLWCCGLLGLGFIGLGILSLFGFNPPSSSGGDGWKTIMIGCMLTGPLLYYWLRPHIARIVTRRLVLEWQLQERLNVDYKTLNRVMSQGGVRPRFIVDGKRYYASSDFAEIALLLRASSAPAMTQESLLLHPATNVATPAEQLLRSAEGIKQDGEQQSQVQKTLQAESRYKRMEQAEGIDVNSRLR